MPCESLTLAVQQLVTAWLPQFDPRKHITIMRLLPPTGASILTSATAPASRKKVKNVNSAILDSESTVSEPVPPAQEHVRHAIFLQTTQCTAAGVKQDI